MLFSSVPFLFVFLPAVLLVYFIVPKRFRNYVLLLASLLFYFFGEPVYVLLLLASSVSGYLHSLVIEARRGTGAAKAALASSLIISLALLAFFKYADFFIGAVNDVTGAGIPLPGVKLPIGISFFTFQTMSYTIDVYRGKVRAERNLASLATFVCLFPQLIAGPIVRYTDVAQELKCRSTTLEGAALGVRRFTLGLGKKVLIANAMGELCAVFRNCNDKSVLFCWIYAIAFTLQIYFDFSGYSDMAIGLGKLFGFSFPENFDYPYISRSITEFWRRWHMTLGGWFRDYVYIPLGGNRCSKGRWLFNIAVVWLLTGLWHGASWTFVVWGAMYGVLLAIEKLFLGKWLDRSGRILPRIYVMFFVTLGFVVFNAGDMATAVADIGGMFGAGGLPLVSGVTIYYLKSYAVLLIVAAVASTPLIKCLALRLDGAKIMTAVEPVIIALVLVCVTAYLVDGSFNPFLYFRF